MDILAVAIFVAIVAVLQYKFTKKVDLLSTKKVTINDDAQNKHHLHQH